ncbi:MAG TPA: hypothetical protein VG871_04940, partial [Vicinamibacterales bacterium]|nr:hypothetical protein [Vicinamibacterales bacterium]
MRRISRLLLVTAALVGVTATAGAQTTDQPAPPPPQSSAPPAAGTLPSALQPAVGEVVVGARLNSTPTMGRFFPYVDLRSGPTLERLRYAT